VTVAVEKTKTPEVRRKKMVRTTAVEPNEPKPQGSAEGKA
jgi:hypothetical protein